MSDRFAPGDVVQLASSASHNARKSGGVSLFSEPTMNVFTVTNMSLCDGDFILVICMGINKFTDDGVEYDSPMALVVAGQKFGWVPESWLDDV